MIDNAAMFKLGYGLYVLTAKGAQDNGCIINTAMQVTAEPNRVLVAVNKQNLTHDIIQYTKEFNLSVLTEGCPFGVYEHFGYQSGKKVDKFAGFKYCQRAGNGIYYLTEGANALLSGKVSEQIDCGTHTLFLADVTAAKVLGGETSVTYDYYQKHVKPKPEETAGAGFRCKVCGYIYEGEELPPDYVCPVCKHGAQDFEKI